MRIMLKRLFAALVAAGVWGSVWAANSDIYYSNTLPTSDTLIWRNVNLADLAGMDAYMNGGSLSTSGTPMGGCYFWSYSAATTSATCQIQIWDGTYTKVCCVTLTQSGADVLGRITRAAYSNSGSNILGQNMATGHNNQTIATSPSAGGYGVYCLSPIFKNKPLAYDRGAFYTWAGGTGGDWLGAGAWRTAGNATTAWKDWALAKFPTAATISVNDLVRIGGEYSHTNVFAAGTTTISGSGALAYRARYFDVSNATVNISVPVSFLQGQTTLISGPGLLHVTQASGDTAYFDLYDGAQFVADSYTGTPGRPVFYSHGGVCTNLYDVGGAYVPYWPAAGTAGVCGIIRNATLTNAGDYNLKQDWILDSGTTMTNAHRVQLNNANVIVKTGAKYVQYCTEATTTARYGTFVGLDQSGTYNTFTIDGGAVEINADDVDARTLAEGFMIACKGGSYDNTTGIVSLVTGSAKVASIIMTSNWVVTDLAKGWRAGSHGEYVQTGGSLETWKIFAGNTTIGGELNSQVWRFLGGTGTIGSVTNGLYTTVDWLMDGYTVKALEDTTAWFARDDGGAPSNAQIFRIGENGLVFDTNGKNVGLDLSLWSVQGPFTKTGAGTLSLNGFSSSKTLAATAGTLAFARPALVGTLALDGAALGFTTTETGASSVEAGAVTLPASGAVTVRLSGTAPAPGTYPLVIAPNLDASRFTLDASAFTGFTGALSATSTALVLTVTASSSTPPAASTDFVWTGAAGDGKIGTPGNWFNNAIPGAGVNVIFDSPATVAIENNVDGFRPAKITFGPNSRVRTISGKAITGVGTILNESAFEVAMTAAIAFEGAINLEAVTRNIDFQGGVTGTICANLTPLARVHKGVYNLTADEWVDLQGADVVPAGSTFNFPGIMKSLPGSYTGSFMVEDGATANIGTICGRTASCGYKWFAVGAGVLNVTERAHAYEYATVFGADDSTGTINYKGIYSASDQTSQMRGRRINIGSDGITFGAHYSNAKTSPIDVYGEVTLGAFADWTLALGSVPENLRMYVQNGSVLTFDTLDSVDGKTARTITVNSHFNSANPSTAKFVQVGPGTMVFTYVNADNYAPYEIREGTLRFSGNGFATTGLVTVGPNARLELVGTHPIPTPIALKGTLALLDGAIADSGAVAVEAGSTLVFALRRTGAGKLVAASFTHPREPVRVLLEADQTVENGEYVLIEGASLTINDLAGFTLEKTGDGWSPMDGALSIKDGNLVFTVSGSSYGAPYLCYRGASTTSEWAGGSHWQPQGGGATTAWIDAANAVFDGTSNGVVIPGGITVNDILVTGTSTYTFSGTGSFLGAGSFVVGGGGGVLWNGPALTQQAIVITNGLFTLGVDAPAAALGGPGSPITVAANGTFDLNADFINADVQNEITHQKKFFIEGEGFNGQGALVNNGSVDNWNSAFRNITLTGDATVGGSKRFDVRALANTASTEPLGVFGKGKTLTVKTTPSSFAVIAGAIDVEKVVIKDGGVFRPEGACAFTIPGGIDILDGSLHTYGSTYPAEVPVRAASETSILDKQSGTTTFNGPFTVEEGATLTSQGAQIALLSGMVTNNGSIVNTAGTLKFMDKVEMHGDVTVQGGTFHHFGKSWEGEGRLNIVGGGACIGGSITNFNAQIGLTISSGSIWWAEKSSSTTEMPKFGPNGRVDVTYTGGTFGFNFVDDYTINGKNLSINKAEHSRTGNLYFVDQVGSKGAHKVLTLEDVDWACANFFVGYNSYQMPLVEFKSGTIYANALQCRNGWVDPNTYDELFRLEGGTLRLTSNGSVESPGNGLCAWTHFQPFFQANKGTIAFDSDSNVEQLRAVGFGDRAGGQVTFDLNGKAVNWKTGLAGAADVTLTGAGTFTSGIGRSDYMRYQGVLTGKWTIDNTGVNDLYGAAGFLGGLRLEEDVVANIKIGGSNLVEGVYLQNGASTFATAKTYTNEFPFAMNDLSLFHARGVVDDFSNCCLLWQGMFYADTAGAWTFAGGYDDSVQFVVDGTPVFEHATWNTCNYGQVQLAVGWHTFRCVQYQAAGGWGAAGWAGNTMNLGFAKTAVANATESNFTRFDAPNLVMKAGPIGAKGGEVNWSYAKYNADTWNTITNFTALGTFKELSRLHIYNSVFSPSISGSVHKFDGWVFVDPSRAGDWAVYVNFDDRGSLRIDGVDSGADGENTTAGLNGSIPGITPGWHRFELRMADNSGNWGPWSGTAGKADPNKPFCRITVNGEQYVFDETQFYFSATRPAEYAGLDGVTDLADGSTLNNTATRACPIWGTLKGQGTLSGPFAFAGENNALAIEGSGTRHQVERVVRIESPSGEMFKGLKKVKALFDKKPGCATYDVCPAPGLTTEGAHQIVVEVKDADGNDYSEDFTAFVSGAHLMLRNAHPAGMAIILR